MKYMTKVNLFNLNNPARSTSPLRWLVMTVALNLSGISAAHSGGLDLEILSKTPYQRLMVGQRSCVDSRGQNVDLRASTAEIFTNRRGEAVRSYSRRSVQVFEVRAQRGPNKYHYLEVITKDQKLNCDLRSQDF